MSSALKAGLVLLEIAVFLTIAIALTASSPSASQGQQTTILVGSRGHMLSLAPMEGGVETLDDAIIVGDLLLTAQPSVPGLRVVTLRPGLEYRNLKNFKTAKDTSAGAKLLQQIDEEPTGTLLIAAVQGLVRPLNGQREELDEFARKLGAELSPFRAPSASWAVICYKLSSGWRVLAEAYSEDRSVNLAFSVSTDPNDYRNHRSEVFYAPEKGPQALDLARNFASAEVLSGKVTYNPWMRLEGQMKGSLIASATQSAPATIRWDHVKLGKRPYFSTAVGKRASASLAAVLRVQGQEVGRLKLGTKGRAGWHMNAVDLSKWEDQSVSIELSVEVLEGATRATAFWGLPELHWGLTE